MKKKAAVILMSICLASGVVQAQDRELETEITTKLVEVFGEDAKTIRVAVADGKAVLIGRVQERSTQELAEEVVLFFPAIRSVDNDLESSKDKNVMEGGLLGEGGDAKLEIEVKSALASEIGKHSKSIEVEVADGMVSIRGSVPDEARLKLAREAAAGVNGVKKLIDLLHVKE